jgi:hypothetical protein
VTRFLVLSREELSAWASDPEGFTDESSDMPRVSPASCDDGFEWRR